MRAFLGQIKVGMQDGCSDLVTSIMSVPGGQPFSGISPSWAAYEDVYRTNEECKIAMASPVAPNGVRIDLCGPVAATGEALFQLCIKVKLRRRLQNSIERAP